MKNLMATAAFTGLLMTGTAYAAQTTLSDQQMDTVTAGCCAISFNPGYWIPGFEPGAPPHFIPYTVPLT